MNNFKLHKTRRETVRTWLEVGPLSTYEGPVSEVEGRLSSVRK